MANRISFLSAVLASSALAQQIGKNTPEVHPLLPTWQCTVKGGCVRKNTSVVLDADYRWTHTVTGYDSCKANGLNSTLCPDAKTCAANCALEGVDYASYGILTNGSELTLNLFVNKTNGPSRSSPRVYLLENSTTYTTFSVLNREIAFDIDASKLPCGSTGALYLSEMSATGGRSDLNPAGATYGTGYCDAQCPSSSFINGEVYFRRNCATKRRENADRDAGEYREVWCLLLIYGVVGCKQGHHCLHCTPMQRHGPVQVQRCVLWEA